MTPVSLNEVESAIHEVRNLVSADGADLQLIDFDSERRHLRLRLDLARVPCLECVVPPPMLASMIRWRVQQLIPDLQVEVEDPRNDGL
jgi:NifU-like domain